MLKLNTCTILTRVNGICQYHNLVPSLCSKPLTSLCRERERERERERDRERERERERENVAMFSKPGLY